MLLFRDDVLATLLAKIGEAANAEPILREALGIRHKTLPHDDWRIASAESALGNCLAALHRYKEAEPLLLRSYPVIKAKQGEQHPFTREALQRAVALYEAWGKPDQAARFRKVASVALTANQFSSGAHNTVVVMRR